MVGPGMGGRGMGGPGRPEQGGRPERGGRQSQDAASLDKAPTNN